MSQSIVKEYANKNTMNRKEKKRKHNPVNGLTYLTPAPTTATVLPESENTATKAINSQKHSEFQKNLTKIKSYELSNKSLKRRIRKKHALKMNKTFSANSC